MLLAPYSLRPLALVRFPVAYFGGTIALLFLLWRRPGKRLLELLIHGGQLLSHDRTGYGDTCVGLHLPQRVAIVGNSLLCLLLLASPEPLAIVLLQPSEIVALPELSEQPLVDRSYRFVTACWLKHRHAQGVRRQRYPRRSLAGGIVQRDLP